MKEKIIKLIEDVLKVPAGTITEDTMIEDVEQWASLAHVMIIGQLEEDVYKRQDDWVSPDYYEKLLKKAEATGADLVGCDYSLVDHHTFEVGKVIVNNTPCLLYTSGYIVDKGDYIIVHF